MLLHEVFKIPTEIALGVVFVLLALAIVASLLFPKKDAEEIKAESALAGVSGETEK